MANQLILIIEDNPNNATLLRDVLQVHGYETLDVPSAEEGLELAVSKRPDLILMDIQLPGIDGVTALRRLRAGEATKAIPVIAVTASAMPMDREKIMRAGFEGYVTKPISVKKFLDEVRALLGKGRSAEE